MTRYLLHVNGYDGSMQQRLGCTCNRCRDPRRTANPSVSLIALDDDGNTIYHLLFDVGHGVRRSLVNCRHLQGEQARLDRVALTHWHPDHTNDLRHLVRGWHFTQQERGSDRPIPQTWCRAGTAQWVKQTNWGSWQTFFRPIIAPEPLPPGHPLPPIPIDLPDVTITPITVSHTNGDIDLHDRDKKVYSCASFVIETPTKKCLLLWDVDTRNAWLGGENTDPATMALLQDADYAFFDCTTWDAHTKYKQHFAHICFTMIMEYVQVIRPKQTFLTHLGGHFDKAGNAGYGYTDEEWQVSAEAEWQRHCLPGTVHVPHIGLELAL